MRIKKIPTAKKLSSFLRSKQFWDIATMLRGPDFGSSSELKSFTVGRIRAVAGITKLQAFRFGVIINPIPLTLVEQKRRDYLLEEASTTHFYQHYNAAVGALRSVAHYDLQTETPIKRIRKQHGKLS